MHVVGEPPIPAHEWLPQVRYSWPRKDWPCHSCDHPTWASATCWDICCPARHHRSGAGKQKYRQRSKHYPGHVEFLHIECAPNLRTKLRIHRKTERASARSRKVRKPTINSAGSLCAPVILTDPLTLASASRQQPKILRLLPPALAYPPRSRPRRSGAASTGPEPP